VTDDDLVQRFADLVHADGEVPLDEACLIIAARDGHLDPRPTLAALDAMAAAVPDRTADAVCAHLVGPEGFTGDQTSYYDARNSLLPDVVERRRGIPITLAVVAIEVGRRCGALLEGVGMPGHFLVQPAGRHDRFVDLFHGGAVLDRAGCQAIHARLHPDASWNEHLLDTVDSRAIVARILANLTNAYRRVGDRVGMCWSMGLRAELPSTSPQDQRELAVLLGASGHFTRAADVLESLGDDRDLRAAARMRARLN